MPYADRRPLLLASLTLGTAVLGCADRTLDDDTDAPVTTVTTAATAATDASTAATADATTSAPQPTTAAPDPTTGPGSTSTTGAGDGTTDPTSGFVHGPDLPPSKECDPWEADCPEGQKCAPVSLDGDDGWNDVHCVPVVRDPDGVGEPCEALGSDGDTCAKGHACWDVDPDTGLGVCIAQCIGSDTRPDCADPNLICNLSPSGYFSFCFPSCDPLLQDCPGSNLCVLNPSDGGHTFFCVHDASGDEGQTFDPCGFVNDCDPGRFCLDPVLAVECDPQAVGCCLPVCDLTAALDCPGAGQQCLPWYEEGTAPPGLEDVGVCGLP